MICRIDTVCESTDFDILVSPSGEIHFPGEGQKMLHDIHVADPKGIGGPQADSPVVRILNVFEQHLN